MASNTKQQKRAKRAATKAKQNRMVRSGQAVKASAGDSASVEQVFNKAMDSGSYNSLFDKMKEAQQNGLVSMISVFWSIRCWPWCSRATRKNTPPTTSSWSSLPIANGSTAATKMPPWPGWKATSSKRPMWQPPEAVAKQQQQQKQFG